MDFLSSERVHYNRRSSQARSSQAAFLKAAWFASITGLALLLSFVMIRNGPNAALLAWILFFVSAAAILYRPRFGVYLLVFLGLMGDVVLSPWFPFVKNFSSLESILYISDSIVFNPLEAFLGLTFISWFIHAVSLNKKRFYRGPLFLPAMVFLFFTIAGLWYGLSAGGDFNIGLWEARPIFYLIAMIVLVSNLIETREHVNKLIWFAMIAILIDGLFGHRYFWFVLRGNLEGVNAITEHSAAIHMNSLFVFFLAGLLYKISQTKRFVLALFSLVVIVPYFATQRRAAFLTLGLALIVIAVVLYKENRSAFWTIVPPAIVLVVIYIIAFWNMPGFLGTPVQAFKSMLGPEYVNERNLASNTYRDLENINLHFTIQQKPLTGVGFGNIYYIIVPMPDISFFQWWQYFTHNSIIWIWLKTGVMGFISMLYLVSYSLAVGGRTLVRMPGKDLSAIALTALLYLIMHFTYAYADISWDSQSMLYVGAMMGLLNSLVVIAAKPIPVAGKRWRWQENPSLDPASAPLSNPPGTAAARQLP
jgi:hypothetical protein